MRPEPYVPRMMRVSPPELEREFPGPQASSSVTFAPFSRSCSAVQPPKAPAPTTITDFRGELANACSPIRYAPTAVELFKKVRREVPVKAIQKFYNQRRPEHPFSSLPSGAT